MQPFQKLVEESWEARRWGAGIEVGLGSAGAGEGGTLWIVLVVTPMLDASWSCRRDLTAAANFCLKELENVLVAGSSIVFRVTTRSSGGIVDNFIKTWLRSSLSSKAGFDGSELMEASSPVKAADNLTTQSGPSDPANLHVPIFSLHLKTMNCSTTVESVKPGATREKDTFLARNWVKRVGREAEEYWSSVQVRKGGRSSVPTLVGKRIK